MVEEGTCTTVYATSQSPQHVRTQVLQRKLSRVRHVPRAELRAARVAVVWGRVASFALVLAAVRAVRAPRRAQQHRKREAGFAVVRVQAPPCKVHMTSIALSRDIFAAHRSNLNLLFYAAVQGPRGLRQQVHERRAEGRGT
eukprot:568740-Pleurochrysis_carterae.AAC.3